MIESPPPYTSAWCTRCGSPAPFVSGEGDWFEVAAGLFDDDLPITPDKHIYFECGANWDEITDGLPRYDKPSLNTLRAGHVIG
jgi:hypothetical protein